MKRGFNLVLVVLAVVTGFSCNNTKSYTDMLNDQKKAIAKLIDENEFVILNSYPEDGKFGEKEFVNIGNGVYMNVIDSGRGEKAELGVTVVDCRFSGYYLLGSYWTEEAGGISNFSSGWQPMTFKYGVYSVNSNSDYDEAFLSEAINMPLALLRDSAVVKLIIPFNEVGSSYAQSGYPLYLDRVRYYFR